MDNKNICPLCSIMGADDHSGHRLFMAIFDSSSYGIVLIKDDKFHSANPALISMLGYTEKELLSLDRKTVTHPDDFVDKKAALASMKKDGYLKISRDTRYIRKDGSIFYGRTEGIIFSEKGHSMGIVFIQDITKEKESLLKLNEIKENYRLTIDSMTDMIHVVDEDLRIILVNQGLLEWSDRLGFPKDVIGMRLEEVFPFLPATIIEEYRIVFQSARYLNTIERNTVKGKVIHTETRKKPMIVDGKVKEVLTVVRDITLQRNAEKALKESEEKYARITENALDSIFTKDKDRRYTYINPAMEKLLGIGKDEIIGRIPEEIFPKKAARQIQEVDDICYGGEIADMVKELDISGKRLVLHTIQAPIRDEEGIVIGISGIVRDITGIRVAERKLLKSKEKFENYVNIAGVIILALDKDGVVTFINKKGCEIMGLPKDEIIGKDWFTSFIPEKKSLNIKSVFESLMAGDIKVAGRNENKVITSRGQRLISWENTVLLDCNGKIVGTLSSGEDITDRKKDEEELNKSKELLEGVVNSASDMIFSTDKKSILTSWNPTAEFVTGFRSDEMIDTSIFDSPVFNDIDRIQEFMTDELIDRRFRLSLTSKRGKEKTIEVTVSALEGHKGTIGFVFIGRELKRQSKSIEKGRAYLVQDSNLASLIEIIPAYKDIFYISRNVDDQESLHRYSVRCLNLNQKLLSEGLVSIMQELRSSDGGSLIFLDRIDYLISLFGFDGFMRFLYSLVDLVRDKDNVLIVNADRTLLSEKEFGLLQSELVYFEDSVPQEIDYEFLEIMRFIAEKEMMNLTVTIKEIRINLKISSVTARKRIAEIVDRGLVMIQKKGRSKVISLTQTGKSTVKLHYNITI